MASVPLRSSELSSKVPPCRLDEVLHDGQAEPGAALGRLVGQRALAEGLHDAGDLLLGNAGAGVA